MKLDSTRTDYALQPNSQNLTWLKKFVLITKQEDYQAGSWVKLVELPNPYSFDEALLLCSISQNEWVVWIPDHGEAVLHIEQFYGIGQ